jgi:hypothetical protein
MERRKFTREFKLEGRNVAIKYRWARLFFRILPASRFSARRGSPAFASALGNPDHD